MMPVEYKTYALAPSPAALATASGDPSNESRNVGAASGVAASNTAKLPSLDNVTICPSAVTVPPTCMRVLSLPSVNAVTASRVSAFHTRTALSAPWLTI